MSPVVDHASCLLPQIVRAVCNLGGIVCSKPDNHIASQGIPPHLVSMTVKGSNSVDPAAESSLSGNHSPGHTAPQILPGIFPENHSAVLCLAESIAVRSLPGPLKYMKNLHSRPIGINLGRLDGVSVSQFCQRTIRQTVKGAVKQTAVMVDDRRSEDQLHVSVPIHICRGKRMVSLARQRAVYGAGTFFCVWMTAERIFHGNMAAVHPKPLLKLPFFQVISRDTASGVIPPADDKAGMDAV